MEIEQIKGSTFIGFISISFKVFQTRFQLFVSIILYILLGNHISVHKVNNIVYKVALVASHLTST